MMIERWVLSIDLLEVAIGFMLGNLTFFLSTILTSPRVQSAILRTIYRGVRPIVRLVRWCRVKASKKIKRYRKKRRNRLARMREQWYDIQQQSYFEAVEDGRKPW